MEAVSTTQLILMFVFSMLLLPTVTVCRPTKAADTSFLELDQAGLSSDEEIGNAANFRISADGAITKFAVLLKKKLAEEEKYAMQKKSNSATTKNRRSRSLFFRICVRFRNNQCFRRKRFGLWHSFRKDTQS